jgi:hypothetical protein
MPHDLDVLERERQFRQQEVERKREALRELLVQRVCFSNLVTNNQQREATPLEERIPLPFIVVNTIESAVIQCEMSPDRTDVMFDFSMPFEINDDNTILKHLGMCVITILLRYCMFSLFETHSYILVSEYVGTRRIWIPFKTCCLVICFTTAKSTGSWTLSLINLLLVLTHKCHRMLLRIQKSRRGKMGCYIDLDVHSRHDV